MHIGLDVIAKESPRVSVVIPTRNRAEWLPRAVAGVLAQTWTDFELLIVDRSTDETPAVIARFADRRIRSFRHERNMGQSKALNTGIKHARGEYVAFLDDDDEWLPGKLAAQVALLDAAPPAVGLVYCWRDELEEAGRRRKVWECVANLLDIRRDEPDEAGRRRKVWECVANLLDIRRDEPDEAGRRRIGTPRLTLRGDIFEHVLALHLPASPSSWLVRRSIARSVGGFDEGLHRAKDVDFVSRICARGWHVDFVPRVALLKHRHARGQMTDRTPENLAARAGMVRAHLARFARELSERPATHARVHLWLARYELPYGSRRAALASVATAFRLDPIGMCRRGFRHWRLAAGMLARLIRRSS